MFTRLRFTPVKKQDRMSSYWKKEWRTILVVAVSGLIFDGGMSFVPMLQGRLLDAVIYDATWEKIISQAVLFLGAVLLIQLMRGLKRFSVRVFANQTGAVMRDEIYHNILHRHFSELVREEAGDLLNKAVNDVDLCVEGMRKVTTEVFDTGVLMTGYFIMMLYYDVKLTFAACILIPVAMWIANRLKGVVVRWNKEARSQSSKMAQLTYDDVEHMILYRINGVFPKKRLKYHKVLQELETKSVKANVLETSMQPIYNAISMLGIGAIFVMGTTKVWEGAWTIGMLTAYISLFTALAVKASKASKLFNSFQKSVVSWKRLKPYYSVVPKEELSAKADRGYKDFKKSSSTMVSLQVRDLSFSYPGSEKLLFEHIFMELKEGDFLGVTGPVACGKTSLGLALTGIYPYKGSIQIQGEELNLLSNESLRGLIGYQGHGAELLSDTIYQNVTMGIDGDITRVLQDVCFDEDLKNMPEGINTIVGNSGVRLSGGQQARIALARALWHPSIIKILDDPFSAVDMGTETQIIQNLRTHYPNHIFVILSHRLAAFSMFEQVMYLEQGQAVIGRHEELLALAPGYGELYGKQDRGDQL